MKCCKHGQPRPSVVVAPPFERMDVTAEGNIMTKQSGGCLCGKVTYEFDGNPIATAVCHCANCQRQSGAAFSINILARETQLSVSGDLSTYEDAGENGNKVYRKFCPNCGSPIISALESMPGLVALKVGTLDDASAVKPSVQLWCTSKQNWLELAADLPGFPKDAPTG